MEITLFAKKRITKEGKSFYNYLTTLIDKNGNKKVATVKFKDTIQAPKPENCPVNIVVEKEDCNLSTRQMTRKIIDPDSGEVTERTFDSNTLWVSCYKDGSPFVDHSMDDYF